MTSTTFDIDSIATRHGFSTEAVHAAWNALQRGGGSMAQFSHSELGGAGQWIPGMLMIGDMFNHRLKARVASLFEELRNQPTESVAATEPIGRSWQRQSDAHNGVSLRYGASETTERSWYPAELGFPSSAGSQNRVQYAYFPETRRLAIELFGKVTIYDTGEHRISGVSQSQTNNAGDLTFTSQFGVIPVSTLKVV